MVSNIQEKDAHHFVGTMIGIIVLNIDIENKKNNNNQLMINHEY